MYWNEFFIIAVAHLFAVASPGPDFAVVLKQSVTGGTRVGVWTSLGVGSAILLHVTYCVLGVAVLLTQSPVLFMLVRYLAAVYLLYLGVMAIRVSFSGSEEKEVVSSVVSVKPLQAFYLGFLTNGLNPKATLFFLSLFTVVISPTTPILVQAGYGIYLAVATFVWFASLSVLLGREKFKRSMLKLGVWFERIMGFILILLAVQIAVFA
jgi:threonine/homoserine/homoserine lactone efflux protein